MYTLEQIDALACAAAENRKRELYELAAITRAATQAMPRDFERFLRGLEPDGRSGPRGAGRAKGRRATADADDVAAFADAVNALAADRAERAQALSQTGEED